MSGLSALASYSISDEEDVERESGDEEVKGDGDEEEEQEVSPDKVQEEEKEAPKENTVDDEDIWRGPDEDPPIEEEDESKSDNAEENEDGDENLADHSIKDVEELSALQLGSEEEGQDEDGGESSGGENEGTDSLGEAMKVKAKRRSKRSSSENAMNLAKKLRSSSVDEVSIPPEPEGRCSSSLQEKITRFMERKVKDGEDLNRAIHARKDFRNPSIYEKLILYLRIEELGTNFPPEDYAPKVWRKAPAYDELARAQREDIAKREKERKTKVEFVTGTVKKPTSSTQASSSSEGAKKSKWDQQTSSKGEKSGGSKQTVISAVGSVKKPKV